MRLNIAFVNSIPIFGGGEVWTLEAAREMERRGHAAIVVCRKGAAIKSRAESAGVDVVEFPFGGDLDPLAIRRAARLLNKFLIDVVVANTDKDLRLFGLASKFGGRAAVVARKGVDRPLKNALRYRFAYNRLASAVVANSESTKRTMLASAPRLDPERVTTIHNGIDVEKFERAAPLDFRSRGVPENARVVGFLGRLCEQKGVDVLIDAFAQVAEKRADVVLALAGEGEMEALVRERARAAGVEERVLFLGFLDDPAPFLKAIDLFVLSSRWEGFGIVLAEAMAAGKPCVTTDAGSVVEIVEDKTTGLVVPPEDPDALARAMERLIDDGDLAKRMGDAGARRVREKFTVERMGDDYERLFYRIAKRPRVRVSAETLRPDVKKICIIKPRGIGDIVLSTILLDNLVAAFPDAEIHYFVEKFARDAVEDLPQVAKALTTKRKESSLKMAKKLRAERYDLIIDSWSNPRSAQAVFLSGARYRVGYAYRGRRYAYNLPVWHRRERKSHAAESNLPLLRFLDLPEITKRVHYNVPDRLLDEARRFIAEAFPDAALIAGVAPAGGWASKRCDKEKWAEIGEALVDELDASIVVVWGPGDEEDAEHIERALGDRAARIPKTTVKEMSAYLAACDIVLANDSGPMHIAAAVGVPTLGVFGPTNPEAHGPYSPVSGYVIKDDLDCIRCGKFDCPYDHECMRLLPASAVVEKARETLAKARRGE